MNRENQEHLNHETDLENQCDQLASLVSELVVHLILDFSITLDIFIIAYQRLFFFQELLPRLMGKIKDQFVAIEKLAEFQQQRAPSNASDPPSTLFFTWKASRFGIPLLYLHFTLFTCDLVQLIRLFYKFLFPVKVATTINDAFHEEFKIKKCIAENIAHCEDRQMLDFHKIAWVHQACLTPDVKLQLESLLVETGQR